MPPLSPSRIRLVGPFAVLCVAAAVFVPAAAQGVASAASKVIIEMPVGATVVTGVLNQASLPTIGPVTSVTPGAVGPATLSHQAAPLPAAGQSNLITVFGNGDTELVSDTTISVRIAPVALQDLGGQLGDSLEARADGPVMVIAQFN
jgi:hypothetical protein